MTTTAGPRPTAAALVAAIVAIAGSLGQCILCRTWHPPADLEAGVWCPRCAIVCRPNPHRR